MAQTRLLAGAMSGTSADGVDVALVRIAGSGTAMRASLVHHHQRPYDAGTKASIHALRGDGVCALAQLARIGREITLTYAAALNEALVAKGIAASDVIAVAAHGQTLFHRPPLTVQWLDPSLLAAETGCAVVSDFRRADCAAGGHGAPLVPFADYVLFRDNARSRVLVNIGGIANITYLRARGAIDELIAFDTGPGNCISDHIMRGRGDVGFDADGALAEAGTCNPALVSRMIHHGYFLEEPPKTTDVPAMLAAYQQARQEIIADAQFPIADELATACEITARSIVEAIFSMDFVPKYPGEIIISGGGIRNRAIVRCLQRALARLGDSGDPTTLLSKIRLRTCDELGLPSQAREAVSFALLGAATLDGIASNVPSATGARRQVVLGSITPRP